MPIKMIKPPAEALDYFFENSRYDAATGKFYRRGKEAGWTDPNGYRLLRIKQKHLVRVHHLVWLIHTGEWPTSEIDHIDNDPSNNEFGNLRLANRNGQGANQTLQKRRVGKYKGVHQSSSGKFYVKIKVAGLSEDSKEQMLADLSVRLSKLAAELNVGIVTIAHTNEDGQTKYCRMIGQRASVILDLKRDKDADTIEERNTTYITIEKNRPCSEEGAAGKMRFNTETFTLREVD